MAFVEADARRVSCRRHGVLAGAVPLARHASRFTTAFEDETAWLAVNCSKTAVAELMRIAWRTVRWICQRVAGDAQHRVDPLAGLRRIGIDEISQRTGQRYLTVVVCHDSGRLVWPAARRDRKTVESFLDQLGEERCKQLELVSADMAAWVAARSASAARRRSCAWTPSTSSRLATDALDEIRREVCNDARRAGQTQLARDLKGARFALWKNPDRLTDRQAAKLADLQRTNARLYRAYLIKEQLRQI